MGDHRAGNIDVASSQICITGESPLWDHRCDKLHWVDIRGPAILTLDPSTGVTTRRPVADMIGFVALTARPHQLVAGLRNGLHLIDLANGDCSLISRVEPDKPDNRINDGVVAQDGAVLFGTLDCDYQSPTGSFWRFARGQLTPLGGAAIVTNGPAVAANGVTVFTVDSVARTITRHRYENDLFIADGIFTALPPGQGVPDGIAFDREGGLWVAHYGGGRISHYRPDGSVDQVITLPASQITKCAFGGPDLRTLYITSAAYRRSLADEPLAGALFKTVVDVPGLPAHIADV